MDINEVPQEGNRTMGGHKRAMYARDTDGRFVIVASAGGEVDETVTLQALEFIREQTEAARARVEAGEVSRSNIRKFATLNPDDRIAILSLISPLKLGENRLGDANPFRRDLPRKSKSSQRDCTTA